MSKTQNKAIRAAARGQCCTLMLPGVGTHGRDTVVWAHSPFLQDGKGMGMKSREWCGCFACHACHDILDGRVKSDIDRGFLRARFYEAMKMSLMKLEDLGVALW